MRVCDRQSRTLFRQAVLSTWTCIKVRHEIGSGTWSTHGSRDASGTRLRMNVQYVLGVQTTFPVNMILLSGNDRLAESTERYYKRIWHGCQRRTNLIELLLDTLVGRCFNNSSLLYTQYSKDWDIRHCWVCSEYEIALLDSCISVNRK